MQPGQPDMQMLMQQAQQMQEQMTAELETVDVTGQAGNGLVQVVMSAGLEVRSVRIDPKVVDPADVETLQDLVITAVQEAVQAAGEAAQEVQAAKLGPLMGGLGLPGLG